MTIGTWDYTYAEFVAALRRIGLAEGDIVYVQNCGESLGQPRGCDTSEQISALMVDALREVVGETGTILIATYTFSACRREIFDVDHTPAVPGVWSSFGPFMEYFRMLPDAVRSPDPIFSVAGIGPRAAELLSNPSHYSLGEDCIHDRLRKVNGKICMIGIGLFEATFRHYVEAMAQVPWRFNKLFTGYVRNGSNVLHKTGRVYNVRILAPHGDPAGEQLEAQARELGLCKAAPVGQNEVVAIESAAYYELGMREMAHDPWYSARGPAGDPVAIEDERVQGPQYDVHLPPSATMEQMIDALWWLPRDIVSTGYDSALHALASQVPMTIHEYPTGTECWTWIVPEKWTCYEAYLETLDGQRLFSYADHPLHVVSYSLPFAGEVSRDELFQHLHTHPMLPDAIPFIFKYYERDWGLCCSKNLKDALTDEHYRVVIRSTFSYSTLKVGEIVVPGRRDECIVLAAHLCHPAMVNDDLSGVVVGIDVMRELLKRQDLEYTYRFLIVPETIGSIAYLSHNEHLIPHMRGGLFLEMLGIDNPHAIQLSYTGNTSMDQCVTLAARHADPYSWTAPFRQIIQNDEVQFNAPGVRVPMLSLSRVLPSSPRLPYREYHSSHDTPANASLKRMAESRDLVLAIIDTLEQNEVPVNLFAGEVFCSRYGLHIDWYTNPEGNKALFDIIHMIDGSRSLADIAEACGISFQAARQTIDELTRHGLVRYRRA
jgi:aminopeptidase-like protein/aminoglycoside N3'-acetyltransferase